MLKQGCNLVSLTVNCGALNIENFLRWNPEFILARLHLVLSTALDPMGAR